MRDQEYNYIYWVQSVYYGPLYIVYNYVVCMGLNGCGFIIVSLTHEHI